MPTPESYLPGSTVRAANTVYQSGISLSEIARHIYRRHGYSTPHACRKALRKHFALYRYRLRSQSEARRLMFIQSGCAACGCELSKRTVGCDRCTQRHSKYKQHGRAYVASVCRGCGCHYDQITDGCHACVSRASRRRKRASAAPPPALRTADTPGGGTTTQEVAA